MDARRSSRRNKVHLAEVVPLLRRDHKHDHRHRQELQSRQRECEDHHRAEVHRHLHLRHFELDREQHLDPLDSNCRLDEEEETLAEDYAHQEQRIAFLKSGRDFVISTVEGPHSTREFGSNLQWKQYVRRLTFYAALPYNILTERQLDSHMLNASEFEWLKLYHYISTSTELVRCKGYPVTEVLAMLTLGVEPTVKGDIRNKLKSLGNKIGQLIVGKPWMDKWDELGGQVRNNKSLILTDLTYQTRSSSRTVHDIEAGLNNMGVSFVKVYQLPYESPEKPGEFLHTAEEALNFLRANAHTLPNVTVHVWISFISLIRGQSRVLVPEDGYVHKLAKIIVDISKNSPLPIFVNILTDARFLGSKSSIVSIAEEFAAILKSKGILHSTNEKFWKQMFACGSEPFYWKQGEGKEVIWAMLQSL